MKFAIPRRFKKAAMVQTFVAAILVSGSAQAQTADPPEYGAVATATDATATNQSNRPATGSNNGSPPTADGSQIAPIGSTQEPSANPPPLQIFGALDVGETYTTNAGGNFGLPNSPSDTYTRTMAQLGITYDTRRLDLKLNYGLTGNFYSRFSELDNYTNNLNLAANAKLIPDQLELNINGFATPTALNRAGAISAGGELISNTNNRNSYGYSVQPVYIVRLGNYATSVTSASEGGVFFTSPSTLNLGPVLTQPVQNETSFSASEKISSGDYFSRLTWALLGSYDKYDQDNDSQTRYDGIAQLAYAVNRYFSVLATGGYDNFTATVPLTKNLSGPAALGGVSITDGPTFRFSAQAGIRNHFPNYVASLQWKITPLTSVTGSLTDTITTPQGDILTNLANFGQTLLNTDSSQQSNTVQTSQQALTPAFGTISPISSQGLSLDNSIYHDRQFNVTLNHQAVRTLYGLSFYGETRDQVSSLILGLKPHTSLWGVNASASRRLRLDLTAFLSASYSVANEFNGRDKILNLGAGVSYELSDVLSIYLNDNYLHRDTNGEIGVINAPLSDEEVTIGVRRAF